MVFSLHSWKILVAKVLTSEEKKVIFGNAVNHYCMLMV